LDQLNGWQNHAGMPRPVDAGPPLPGVTASRQEAAVEFLKAVDTPNDLVEADGLVPPVALCVRRGSLADLVIRQKVVRAAAEECDHVMKERATDGEIEMQGGFLDSLGFGHVCDSGRGTMMGSELGPGSLGERGRPPVDETRRRAVTIRLETEPLSLSTIVMVRSG